MRKRMLKALRGPAALKALQADLVRAESLGMPSDYCGRLTVSARGCVGYLRCHAKGHLYPAGELWLADEHRIVDLVSWLDPDLQGLVNRVEQRARHSAEAISLPPSQGRSSVPPMPPGAFVKEEQVAPPMPPGAFVKEEGVVPPMPPDAIVKREQEVVKEEERSHGRAKRRRSK